MPDNEKEPSNETQPPLAQQPAPSLKPFNATSQPQRVACPKCSSIVLAGTQFCPICGGLLLSTGPRAWPIVTPRAAPRRRVRRKVGIALIIVLVVGIAGFAAYQQVGKYSERMYADQSPNQIQIVCFSTRNDNSTLSHSNGVYSGYTTFYLTLGLSNSANLVIDATWTLVVDVDSGFLIQRDTARFQLLSYGRAYPTFALRTTATQLNGQPLPAGSLRIVVTLDGTYKITGSYDTYNLTRHFAYDSSANTGSGPLAVLDLPLPDCSFLPR